MDEALQKRILEFQRNEITEHYVYSRLSERADEKNSKVLKKIADDELRHYNEWKKFTGKDVSPDVHKIRKYSFISRIFGITFAIKMMEMGEESAIETYGEISKRIPGAEKIAREEVVHEKMLINMIDEEKIGYVGSMVLGLNDALVELTGALAGLSFALQNTRLIGFIGLITGISAAMSMAASEYLSKKSEKGEKNPIRASLYTGIAYIFTVIMLVLPYFIFERYYFALIGTLLIGVFIVFLFTFFVSVVKEISFRRMFLEMLAISMGVAAVSFMIGFGVKVLFSVNI
jgi:VIT1/CCC1 family predicted Fe2+/Mn2+ transporter